MPPQALTSAGTTPLQGDALLSFLDNALEQLFTDSTSPRISRADRENALTELLQQQLFAPRTLQELDSLHNAWMTADQPRLAVQALQIHREQVLQGLQDSALWQTQAALDLNTAQSLARYDTPAAHAVLAQALEPIQQLEGEALTQAYYRWMSLVESSQAYALADDAIETLAPRLEPEDAQDFAGRLQPWLDKTRLAHARGDSAAALAHATAAIDRFVQLHDDEVHPDFNAWAQVGDSLLHTAPASIAHWAASSQAHLQRTEAQAPSPAVQKHRDVYSARLQALACHQLGQLEQAIAWGRQGRFELSVFEGDDFVASWMEWLDAANLLDELAPFALESAFHSRPAGLQVAWQIAQSRIDSDAAHRPTWALILAWCCMDRECRERLPAAPHPAQHYLDIALQAQPDDPLVDLMRGLQLARSRKQWAAALPLLERGCSAHAWLCNSEVVLMLWAARFHVHGQAALHLPIPAAPSGHWSYGLGVALDDDDDMKPYMGGKKNLPDRELRQALVQHYYAQGLAHFEQFWQTGQGSFKDGDIHTYSMLCNNLAIKLRHSEDYPAAIALHEKGLASSPFAEHLHGLLWCCIMPDDHPGIARTAEQLWHYAREHGYSRHAPCQYFNWAAEALHHLDRHAEISIWLERLDMWWQEEGDADDAQARAAYLECLLIMLDFFANAHANLVVPRLLALAQEIQPIDNLLLQRRLGSTLLACGHAAQALPFLEKAVALCATNADDFEAQFAPQDLQRCHEALAAATAAPAHKPWWKLW